MKSLVNFRDIGNIATQDGKRVKPNLFLRSGEVVNVHQSTVDRLLNEYKLETIIDLRGEKETTERPDDTLTGVDYVNIDILKDVKGQGASFEDLLKGAGTADIGMLELYEELVLTDGARRGYQQFLELILNKPKSPILFHCFAGKDRTGMAAAIILKSLNVSDKLIFDDYLKTNAMRKKANQLIVNDLRSKGLTEEQLNEVLVMMNVDKRYLEHSFKIIDKEFGGFEQYITEGLRMPKDFFTEMKGNFIA
ncbi:tyrosine-protein phosphatase [Vagococcus fluvialis]|uniref:tyrosine-protein phosphatase n=1 Tax=Vagococcus fluvialis TaxID=2738 RepID=UPI001A905D1A|nr:tyrosine-protein phosphatase [Vagococcus fluvialis]MBO0438058.1 tyrosine-protein phosphatase [Vagococcus fluvialis]